MAAEIFTLSTEVFARRVGVTEKRLRQLAEEGHFPLPRNGMWDEERCYTGAFTYYRKKKEDLRTDDEALKLAADRELSELKLAKAKGEVYPSRAVDKFHAEVFTVIRQKVSALASRLSPNAAFWKSQQEAHAAIARETDEVLEVLSRPETYSVTEDDFDETADAEDTEAVPDAPIAKA